ncbi:PREDICTED: uncharacterized protein LOC100634602 [Amphimedon queenslandica]|uniref:Cytochrome c oxidase subunit n=1 Tax=Amphimedon queenslandica TaxID=400682 RepID=A0A1X7V9R8_AMPQE|nr:PREDICTED: uncharacterized protein LOC100634602 [Amphimedon queenslandica]|eukprot:XP_003385305.1 PREDICTED: uncharacterized protein LOC100634602 [Amphimedon queenslandica]
MATVYRSLLVRRFFSAYSKRVEEEQVHAGQVMKLWKRISLFVAIPAVSYLTWKLIITEEGHHEQREYIPWSHMRIRNKPFPWKDSDKTLFHNPLTNPGPPEEPKDEEPPATLSTKWIQSKWIEYLYEDPEERDKELEEHLIAMQRKHELHLEWKKLPHEPMQPMNLFREKAATPVSKEEFVYNTI